MRPSNPPRDVATRSNQASLSTLAVLALLVFWRQQNAGYWWRQMQPSCGGDGHRCRTFTSAQRRDHVLVYLKELSPQWQIRAAGFNKRGFYSSIFQEGITQSKNVVKPAWCFKKSLWIGNAVSELYEHLLWTSQHPPAAFALSLAAFRGRRLRPPDFALWRKLP